MSVVVSLSPLPRAHPPRSNPFLRSSSDAPPFPCITPSMVTWVMVVSFTVRFLSAPPLVGGFTPATNGTAPIRHPPPNSFEDSRDAGRLGRSVLGVDEEALEL